MQNGVAITLAIGASVIAHLATRVYFPGSLPLSEIAKPTRVIELEPCVDRSESSERGDAPPAAPCDACMAAASSGNITSAASSFNKCTDAGKRSACQAAARGQASEAVKSQTFNGQCAQAKATARAGAAMGIRGLDELIEKSSCK